MPKINRDATKAKCIKLSTHIYNKLEDSGVYLPEWLIENILDAVSLKKMYNVVIIRDSEELFKTYFNGYVREVDDDKDIIDRYNIDLIYGYMRPDYVQNTRKLSVKRLCSELVIFRHTKLSMGVHKEEGFKRTSEFNLVIYSGGAVDETL